MISETLAPAPGTEKRSMGSRIFLGKYRVSAEEMTRVEDSSERPLKYEGEEIDSGKKVTVEAVRIAFLKKEERERLEAHANGAKNLNDVNIHALHDFGIQDDQLIYVTEDIEGTVAEEWVKTNGPMPLGPVLRIVAQVVSALKVAGSQRVVHRAIIPSNLLLLPGETAKGEWPWVKLLHFEGVTSKPAGGETASSNRSLPYTSPEQLRYGVVDSRSEVYSLGATMWFLLTGAPPPMGPEGLIVTQPAKAGPADKVLPIPEKLQELLATALSVNPTARPRDPFAFYLQLQEFLTQAGPHAPTSRALGPLPESATKAVSESEERRIPVRMIALALAVLVLSIAVLATVFIPRFTRSERTVPAAPVAVVPASVPNVLPSPVPASTAGPVVMVAQAKADTPQQAPESAVNVTLVNYSPLSGTPGGKDYKIATLTFRFEASAPVSVTEASFYVDSIAFRDGSAYKPPITLLIHPGVLLGPPGTKVDPTHPIERTIWLKSQENLFSNWQLAYDQTENATFRWTIAGQPAGGSLVRPLRKAWSDPRPSPEVRRAVPAKPE